MKLAEQFAHHEFERTLGRFKLVTLVFEFLEPVDDLLRFGSILAEARDNGVDPGHQHAAPGYLGHQHAPAATHQFRVDVFVGNRVLDHGINVHAALVGEGVAADVGRLLVVRHVGNVADRTGHRRQLLHPFRRNALETEFELQVGDDGAQIGIAAALANAVDGALHLGRARLHRHDRVGHRHFAIVVAVDADRHREQRLDPGGDVENVAGERAAVGVTQTETVCARLRRCRQSLQRVVGIGLVAIEEMLRVIHHLFALLLEVANRVADHAQVLIQRGAQDVGNLIIPTLAKDGDGGCAGLQQRQYIAVAGCIDAHLARTAKGNQARVLQLECFDALEKLQIFWIGAGIAGLDEINPKSIQSLDDLDLVLHRIGNALRLGAVPQGGVVNGNPFHA